MTRDPITCTIDTQLQEVAEIMCESNYGEIPIVDDEKKVVGVITDRDITCRTVAVGKNPLTMKAEDCMTRHCVTINENAELKECYSLMEEHQIRRVPVVDAEGHCCGIVAQADIALKASDNKISEVVQKVSKGIL